MSRVWRRRVVQRWALSRAAEKQNVAVRVGNLETALSKDQLKKLYKTPKDYYNKVAHRYDELVKEGWALPVYRAMVLAEAARVTF